jgi:hypothetical protein
MNLTIVLIAKMTEVISMRPHLQQAIFIKELGDRRDRHVVIVIRPHLQAFRIKAIVLDRHHDSSDRHQTPPAGIPY